jgi:hypothetical protein
MVLRYRHYDGSLDKQDLRDDYSFRLCVNAMSLSNVVCGVSAHSKFWFGGDSIYVVHFIWHAFLLLLLFLLFIM